jgi:hypothetical protein
MFDEQYCRRAGWTEGGSAELADGRRWTFPRIRLRLTPRPADGGGHTVAVSRTAGGHALPRLDEWVAAITSPPGAIPGDVYWGARMDAAATLLGLNYELSDDDLAALLVFDPDDERSKSRWDEIDAAILGSGAPKPTPAT